VTCPSSYPPSDTILAVAAPFVSMAISGKPGLEVGEPPRRRRRSRRRLSGEPSPELGEPPGGGEEAVVTMDISGEPGPEVGEPPPTWPPLFTSSSARSSNTFSLSARIGDSSIKRCLLASEVFPTASHKDNKAVPAFRSRSKKTKNRRKKGDDARKSVRLPRIVLHQHILLQNSPFGFASSLLRGAGALF
jgi:hypothetical protein